MAKPKQPRTSKFVPARVDLVASYVFRLKAAGLRIPHFDMVFAELAADKSAKKSEVLSIASRYIGYPLRPRSRDEALNVIKTRFVEMLRFERKQGLT